MTMCTSYKMTIRFVVMRYPICHNYFAKWPVSKRALNIGMLHNSHKLIVEVMKWKVDIYIADMWSYRVALYSHGWESENRLVVRCVLKTGREDAKVTCSGGLFQVWMAEPDMPMTYHLSMNYVTMPTTSCSTRLFACLIMCYIRSFRSHLTHHKDTVCENERIYCNYLIIPHTCQTKSYITHMLYKNAY